MVSAELSKYGVKFRRNKHVYLESGKLRFIDIYLEMDNVAVELDGPEHVVEADGVREEEIKKALGCRFIRFKNSDVYGNLKGVIDEILKHVSKKLDRDRIKKRQLKKQRMKAQRKYFESKVTELQSDHLRSIWQHG